jgi:hypothetical protein
VFLGKERAHELTRVRDEDLGAKLREEICKFLDGVGVPRGLSQVGYTNSDIGKVSILSPHAERKRANMKARSRHAPAEASVGSRANLGQRQPRNGDGTIVRYH